MTEDRFLRIMASLAKSIGLSDHLGDVHEEIDSALKLCGLPEMPVHEDGTMSCGEWLEDVPTLLRLSELLEHETHGLRDSSPSEDIPE